MENHLWSEEMGGYRWGETKLSDVENYVQNVSSGINNNNNNDNDNDNDNDNNNNNNNNKISLKIVYKPLDEVPDDTSNIDT